MVVHGFGYDGKDDHSPISAPNEYIRNLHLSHAAVLLFFILSGYVIGLTNRGDFTRKRAVDYLRKRTLRIVPLYFLALLAGWLAWRAVSPGNVLANAFFLQNTAWGIQPLSGNRPVWSLHYEVIYYLGFLWVWAARPRLWPVFSILLGLALAGWFSGDHLSVVGGWSAGGIFWLAGLCLAWHQPAEGDTPLLTFILLAYATNHLWPGEILLRGLGLSNAGNSAVALSDLALLPCTLAVFCAVTRFNFPGFQLVKWCAFLIPFGTCAILLTMGRLFENVPWTLAALATGAAIPLYFFERESWSKPFFRLFSPLGKISYGLYLLHVPCVAFVVSFYPWNGNPANYVGGVLSWIALTFALAWVSEAKLQRFIVSYFKRSRPARSPS